MTATPAKRWWDDLKVYAQPRLTPMLLPGISHVREAAT
jgi:hypothetical protein